MARVRVRHAGAQSHASRRLREDGEGGVDLAEEPLVGEPDVVVAERFRARDEGRHLGHGARGQQEEAGPKRHPASRSPSAILSAVMGSTVTRSPVAEATALATAAGGSMFGGSPTPLAP